MGAFMKTGFIPATSYRPLSAHLPSQEILRAIRGIGDLVDRIAKDVGHLEVKSVRPNRTGNRVDVKVRVGSVSKTLHMCTVERSGDSRTSKLLREEALLGILDWTPGITNDKHQHVPVVTHIQNRANEFLRETENRTQAFKNAYASTYDVQGALIDAMGEVPDPGLDRVCDAVLQFLARGGIAENRNKHQSSRAIEGVKHAAMHAFRHGVDIEDIMSAVRETLVANVLES